MAAVSLHPLTDEEIKVLVTDGKITTIGKHLGRNRLWRGLWHLLDFPKIRRLPETKLKLLNNPLLFYEAGMDRLLAGGHVMNVLNVGDSVVQELDFPADYEALVKIIAAKSR